MGIALGMGGQEVRFTEGAGISPYHNLNKAQQFPSPDKFDVC